MKIKLFEHFDVDLDTHYEIRILDINGDLSSNVELDDETNPFDLEEVVKFYVKYEKKFHRSIGNKLCIYKVTETYVEDEEIEKIKLKLAAKKYNIL